ncbi:MAG TPA: M28 family peptidase [Longimicrobiales bacterium]
MRRIALATLLPFCVLAAPAAAQQPPVARRQEPAASRRIPADWPRVDADRLLADIRFLASDALAGRRVGTAGNARAREYVLAAFRRIGLEPAGDGYTREFRFIGRRDSVEYHGTNVVGMIRGTEHPDRYIVLTAHYDHVGIGAADASGDSIYNGADDNASGTAALLALAAYFQEHRPAHSILFAALDAEEMGLQGARAFVRHPPVPLASIAVNVNMDMVGRNEKGELYVAGTHHYPFLKPYVERIAARAPVRLLTGHDSPDLPEGQDWTGASDHGAFHAAKIPFLYFGVEDHPDYHRPSDEIDGIQPDFFTAAVETVLAVVLELDRNPPQAR